ncbi:MAG TPA: hypothetical protein VHY08_27320 [Bacillota bacterium]|nr:hypothetical protein [Bacillota bacterium]
MKITESNITMIGQRQYQETRQITQSQPYLPTTIQQLMAPNRLKVDNIEISDQARIRLKTLCGKGLGVGFDVYQFTPTEKLKTEVLDQSLKAITNDQTGIRFISVITENRHIVLAEQRETYRESEQTSFKAGGVIKTADGKEIDFSVDLNMSREFASDKVTILEQKLSDPLVINFDGPVAALTDTKFSFDLDNDGALDQISFLKSGSGFLALDQNQDGVINNGGELFGTASGNGFADLLKYDSDQNGWIDENDSIYEKLRIWTKDENGQDVLFALGQKGIGAIYLGNVDTQFSYKEAANQTQGQVHRTGVFLKEDGTAGTVQQIDLVV